MGGVISTNYESSWYNVDTSWAAQPSSGSDCYPQSDRMQVAAAPQLSTQSPRSIKSIGTTDDYSDFENHTREQRLQLQLADYDRSAKETQERRKKGEEMKLAAQQEERKQLCARYYKDIVQKQEAEKKEHHPGNMASQNGGFNNAISTAKTENSRKRKTEDDNNFSSQPKMPNHAQQPWQMQQPHMHMTPFPQMMQYGNQPRVPPNGSAPQMMPNGTPGMYPNFAPYPPCSTTASTSTAELTTFPNSRMSNSPSVVPSVSVSGVSSNGTPPQMPLQINQTEQGPTPPALVHNSGSLPDDFAGPEGIENLLDPVSNGELHDLGADLDLYMPTSSNDSAQQQQVQSIGTPSNVVSPVDGFQLPVNGPQSVHSHHNPMSNGNCNPPMTPNNGINQSQPQQQPQPQQMPQYPGIGTPMFTSTPKNPMAQMNQMAANSMGQQMNSQSTMGNSMANLQSPQAMQPTMPSPHMPPAMQSPHMAMNTLQSPGLPTAPMPTPAMQPSSMTANPMGPMVMTPNPMGMPGMPGMPINQGHQWMPGPMTGLPQRPDMIPIGMPHPGMTPQMQQQMHMKMMQHQYQMTQMSRFIQENPVPQEWQMSIQQKKVQFDHMRQHIQKTLPLEQAQQELSKLQYQYLVEVWRVHYNYCQQKHMMRQQQYSMMGHPQPSPGYAPFAPYPPPYQ